MLCVSAYKHERRPYSATLNPTSFTVESSLALTIHAQRKTYGWYTLCPMACGGFFVGLYVLGKEWRRTYYATGGYSYHDDSNEGGGDTTIVSSGRSPKQPLPGIGLHDPLHGRQACPKFNSFHEGIGQISPREGHSSAVPSQNVDKFVTSPPPSNR